MSVIITIIIHITLEFFQTNLPILRFVRQTILGGLYDNNKNNSFKQYIIISNVTNDKNEL